MSCASVGCTIAHDAIVWEGSERCMRQCARCDPVKDWRELINNWQNATQYNARLGESNELEMLGPSYVNDPASPTYVNGFDQPIVFIYTSQMHSLPS